MEIINVQYFSEIDDIRDEKELYETEVCCPDIGDDRIMIYGPLFRLRGTALLIAEGTYYRYDEDSGGLEPDFGISLLYESANEPDLACPLYWEEGTPQCMFHNYAIIQQSLGKDTRHLLNCVA